MVMTEKTPKWASGSPARVAASPGETLRYRRGLPTEVRSCKPRHDDTAHVPANDRKRRRSWGMVLLSPYWLDFSERHRAETSAIPRGQKQSDDETMHRRNRVEDTGMSLIQKSLLAMALASLAACATSPSSAKTTPVEVWRGGDDGLTSRFADALEAAFRGAPEFSLSSGKVPGTLVVTIPTNLTWGQVGERTEVTYSVEFTGAPALPLGSSRGSCLEDRLQECAAHVLKDARTAKMKLGR